MKIMIDVDVDLLKAAAKELGTRGEKDTVHAALLAVVAQGERRIERRVRLRNSAGRPDLADPDIMAGAWR